jgi:hypothetical protein
MTSPELLRFFHAEAREYLDAIEGFLAGGSFEAGGFVAASRALRGSATMARVPRIPEIALVLERIANGVRDGEVTWSPAVRGDLSDGVDDLRSFVGAATRWTTEDDRRATRRLAALRAHLPAGAWHGHHLGLHRTPVLCHRVRHRELPRRPGQSWYRR